MSLFLIDYFVISLPSMPTPPFSVVFTADDMFPAPDAFAMLIRVSRHAPLRLMMLLRHSC